MAKEYKAKAYAKINLSIDVGDKTSDGYHTVDMLMQQIEMHDDVTVRWDEDPDRVVGDISIKVQTNRYYLPTDSRNLAYKAVQLMQESYAPKNAGGTVVIDIFKRIPVAAGLAGGSSNGAAVLIALNTLWCAGLDAEKLCKLGAKLGSDVPFCVMGQLGVCTCARALGTGTILEPVKALKLNIALAKPHIGVSTREVYQGIDSCQITERPDNDQLIRDIQDGNYQKLYQGMINVLECYTVNKYKEVKDIKELFQATNAKKVIMSGSGPTVFAIYRTEGEARRACKKMRERKYESNWTQTI